MKDYIVNIIDGVVVQTIWKFVFHKRQFNTIHSSSGFHFVSVVLFQFFCLFFCLFMSVKSECFELIQHCCFKVVGNSPYRCWCTGSWAGSSPSCRRWGEVTGLACHVCPALPGDGDGVGQRDHLSAVGLQEPRLLQQRLMWFFWQQQLVIHKVLRLAQDGTSWFPTIHNSLKVICKLTQFSNTAGSKVALRSPTIGWEETTQVL